MSKLQLKKLVKSVKGISCNSKHIKKDYVFVAIKGTYLDGNTFINEAINSGASCVVSEQKLALKNDITQIIVKDARATYAKLCSTIYKNPSRKLKIIGITGTNGKTTISYLIEAILKKANKACARVGTINYRIGKKKFPAVNTTPDPGILHRLFADMVKGEVKYCIMEASSHALHQQRTDSIIFDSAIFSNLSREHLDYHKTMDGYFSCKKKLFDQVRSNGFSVINIDDKYGKRLYSSVNTKKISYGLSEKATVKARSVKLSINRSVFLLDIPKEQIEITTSLIGAHNIYNILAAVSFAIKEGIGLSVIKSAIEGFLPPPGRLEQIKSKNGFRVYVDYAHTDDALEKVLDSLSKLTLGRIITVFGCGGERDTSKRPRMGKVAARFSNFIILTNDNPRSEDPAKIIDQITKGIPKRFKNYTQIQNRHIAIKKAISMAQPNDVVLIAGKGHERYQILKNKKIHFDDRKVALKCLH